MKGAEDGNKKKIEELISITMITAIIAVFLLIEMTRERRISIEGKEYWMLNIYILQKFSLVCLYNCDPAITAHHSGIFFYNSNMIKMLLEDKAYIFQSNLQINGRVIFDHPNSQIMIWYMNEYRKILNLT